MLHCSRRIGISKGVEDGRRDREFSLFLEQYHGVAACQRGSSDVDPGGFGFDRAVIGRSGDGTLSARSFDIAGGTFGSGHDADWAAGRRAVAGDLVVACTDFISDAASDYSAAIGRMIKLEIEEAAVVSNAATGDDLRDVALSAQIVA